jgi:hypothetical protein
MSRIKKGLKKAARWGKNLFRWNRNVNKNSTTEDEIPDPEYDMPDASSLFRNTININTNGIFPETENAENAFSIIGSFGEYYRELGFKNGILFGAKQQSIMTILRNAASRIRAFIELNFFFNRIEAIQSKLEQAQFLRAQAEHELTLNNDYYRKVEKAMRWRPNAFSLSLSLLYVFSGLILIAADVAISISTIRDGFDIVNIVEIILMAMGIAFSTIYIKIYFDLYILPSIERSVTMFKADNLPGINSTEKKEKNTVKFIWGLRSLFNTALFIFCIYSFFLVANFRFENYKRDSLEKVTEKSRNLSTLFEEENTSKPDNTKAKQELSIFLDLGKDPYVYLSLLFPLVGGICMAMGINKGRNFHILRKARKKFDRAKTLLSNLKEEEILYSEQLKNFQHYAKWCEEGGRFIDDVSDYFHANYIHGYQYGFQKRTKDLDLFKRTKELRKQFAAGQINSSITTLEVAMDFIPKNK